MMLGPLFLRNPTAFSVWEATPFVIHRKGVQKRRPSGLPRSGLISNVYPFAFSFHRVDQLAHIYVLHILLLNIYINRERERGRDR